MKDPEYRKRMQEKELKREEILTRMGLLFNDRDAAKAAGDNTRQTAVEEQLEQLRKELAAL
jgi:hypothetical protein